MTTTYLPPDAPRPRFCQIRKRTPEEEYGFNLHAEKFKGQFIGVVDEGSPAKVAGLRPGDRIVCVNGDFVMNEGHKAVVGKIKENSLQCDLIVVDEDTHNWYTEQKIPIPTDPDFAEIGCEKVTEKEHVHEVAIVHPTAPIPTENVIIEDYAIAVGMPPPGPPSYLEALDDSTLPPHRARLCRLIKPDHGAEFGFNLHAEKGQGHFIGKVDADSIADRAGLVQGQRIVGVNGVLIYPHTPHKDVVSLIKGNPLRTELLVASKDIDEWHQKNAKEFDFTDAEHFVPLEPLEQGIIARGVAQINMNGYKTNGDSGYMNGDRDEDSMEHEKKSPSLGQRYHEDNHEENSPSSYSRSPPPPIEPSYDTIKDNSPSYQQHGHAQQPEWMNLSAAQLRERVGHKKKPDPRKEQLSLQQKHDMIRNM